MPKMTRRSSRLSGAFGTLKSPLSKPTSRYVCLQCRHLASSQQFPSIRQFHYPASTPSFHRSYATESGIADKVGWHKKFTDSMNKRMWKQGEEPATTDQSSEKPLGDGKPRTELQGRPQDGGDSMPMADDVDYIPAVSGEGLEMVGGPSGWWEEAWDEQHQFQGYYIFFAGMPSSQ